MLLLKTKAGSESLPFGIILLFSCRHQRLHIQHQQLFLRTPAAAAGGTSIVSAATSTSTTNAKDDSHNAATTSLARLDRIRRNKTSIDHLYTLAFG